jgi:hypothetical protein
MVRYFQVHNKKTKMAEEKELQIIKQLLDNVENQIRQVRSILFAKEINKKAKALDLESQGDIIEGIYSGEEMVDAEGKSHPVPPNYASKSKLVPGDVLKLTILPDGSFIYKQIGPVKRKKIVGVLEDIGKGKFVVNADNKKYRVLYASVTYFKAVDGDNLTIIVPEKGESEWAAIENIIK